MFGESCFNQNISKWNVSNVKDMSYMFAYSRFKQDLSNWDIVNKDNRRMFAYTNYHENFVKNWKEKLTKEQIKTIFGSYNKKWEE